MHGSFSLILQIYEMWKKKHLITRWSVAFFNLSNENTFHVGTIIIANKENIILKLGNRDFNAVKCASCSASALHDSALSKPFDEGVGNRISAS